MNVKSFEEISYLLFQSAVTVIEPTRALSHHSTQRQTYRVSSTYDSFKTNTTFMFFSVQTVQTAQTVQSFQTVQRIRKKRWGFYIFDVLVKLVGRGRVNFSHAIYYGC